MKVCYFTGKLTVDTNFAYVAQITDSSVKLRKFILCLLTEL